MSVIPSQATLDYRAQFAAEVLRSLAEAIEACGPGADSYGTWTIVDKLGIEPPSTTYCCRRPEHVGWQPKPPENMERIERDVVEFTTLSGIKYEARAITIKGVTYYPFRYQTHFGAITEYHPKTREQLEAAAAARATKREAEIAAAEVERLAEIAARPQLELPFGSPRSA